MLLLVSFLILGLVVIPNIFAEDEVADDVPNQIIDNGGQLIITPGTPTTTIDLPITTTETTISTTNNDEDENEDDDEEREEESETEQELEIETQSIKKKIKIKTNSINTASDTQILRQEIEIEYEEELEIEQEKNENGETRLRATLSNGKSTQIKILPEQASETARRVLGEKFTLEIKERTREINGTPVPQVVYHIEADKTGKFLGLFKMRARISGEIDAETGEIVEKNVPWWAFLLFDEEEIITPLENNTENDSVNA